MLIAIGLSHRSAPIEVREKLSNRLADMKVFVEQLLGCAMSKQTHVHARRSLLHWIMFLLAFHPEKLAHVG